MRGVLHSLSALKAPPDLCRALDLPLIHECSHDRSTCLTPVCAAVGAMRSTDSHNMALLLDTARGRAFDFKAHSTRPGLIEVPPRELERVGRARDLRFCPESGSRHSSVLDVCFQDN